MTDPTAALLAICRRRLDPHAQPVASHAGHNGTVVLEAATTAGTVIVKAHRGPDRHRQEVHAYQHWTPALRGRTPRLLAVDDDPPAIVVTALPGRPLAETRLNARQETEAYRQAGELLRLLHHAAPPRAEPDMAAWRAERGDYWLSLAETILPTQRRAEIRAHLRALTTLGPIPAVPCHLDLTPRNLLRIADGGPDPQHPDHAERHGGWSVAPAIALIDFEHARYDLAARDLVRLATRNWPNRPDLKEAFLETYGNLSDLDYEVIEHCSYFDALTWAVRSARNSMRRGTKI